MERIIIEPDSGGLLHRKAKEKLWFDREDLFKNIHVLSKF